ncbi:hypothetical protein HBH98_192430 [Parastagonospora nodorum]|nr:hypothetical protein HBH52_175560 [Parastagonospora nodorum]KAH4020815.1 hypothetical protein HBI09_180400 [Parastagonospora nodorum]KAH4064304.1 hypothetical protein HBH50_177450 [Parastagonospora nodorum]KAH4084274.1 hypothetical protein HBH48_167030 [Parastagonospora nodorum]KAH4095386.1 hypothetical protein HBH46_167210 [Parastagonospora nodorum]
MAAATELLRPNWVILNQSNVHVAKDRGSFQTYTPWASRLGSISAGGDGTPVFGVGTVDLQTCVDGITTTITLQDVLHVPDYDCNVIGQGIFDDDIVDTSKGEKGGILTESRGQITCTKEDDHLVTVDVLPPGSHVFEPSAFAPGDPDMMPCSWNKAEVQKWEAFKMKYPMALGFDGTRLYIPAERFFMKDNYGGESEFFRQQGLDIKETEDRTLGRAILRGVMHAGRSDQSLVFRWTQNGVFDLASVHRY